MPDYLYRFRSIENLLGRNELENQEIYFSNLKELNDPMEGYKNIFWEGDEIIWRNFLKHYLLCLMHSISMLLLHEDEPNIRDGTGLIKIKILYYPSVTYLPTEQYRQLYQKICTLFFESSKTAALPKNFEKIGKIYKLDLKRYLSKIHLYALKIALTEFIDAKLMPFIDFRPFDNAEKILPDSVYFDALCKVKTEYAHIENFSEKISESIAHVENSLALFRKSQNNNGMYTGNYKNEFLMVDFIDKYFLELETLIYPNYFVSCFSGNPLDSSLWAYYADNHKGVCLKFKINNKTETSSMNFCNGITAWHPLTLMDGDKEYSRGEISMDFDRINYTNAFPEIDFFKSIRRLPMPDLLKTWYRSEDGKRSACADDPLGHPEESSKKYWDNFRKNSLVKLKDWEHEDEYRIVLSSSMFDLESEENRKLKYQFSHLEGIIFGLQTSDADKVKIINLIKAKCAKENRKDFKFSQIVYSNTLARADIRDLSFI